MLPVQIKCEGVQVGSLFLPPFELRTGEFLCLHAPAPVREEIHEAMFVALAGEQPVTGIQRFGRVIAVRPPASGGHRWFWYPRIGQWLAGAAGVPRQEAFPILARVGIDKDYRIAELPCDLRTLAALEAAFARRADVVVFAPIGLGPLTYQRLYEAIAARPHPCAAIQVSYPNTRGERICPQRATCLELHPTATASPQLRRA